MQTDNEKYNETVQPNTAFLNELKAKLPEFFTKEGSFDLDKFRNQLKDKNVNELSEGYQLDFIGKDYARRQAGEMPSTVIVPDEKQNQGEGKDSKNLFFTGDNLEVLRHLQNNYQNKIDVIYIDPPYNTGSDGFVYPDSFEYSDDKLKNMFGLDENQVERLKSIQGKSSHSAWLTFMYPRLALAKRLLSNKGVIFISIDENEYANLYEILGELFNENNLIADFIWRKKTGANDAKDIATLTEHILCFGKNRQILIDNKLFSRDKESRKNDRYNKKDDFFNERGNFYFDTLDRGGLSYSDSLNYAIEAPDGTKLFPNDRKSYYNDGWIWKWSKEKVDWGIKNGYISIVKNENRKSGWSVKYKVYELVDNNGKPRENIGRAFSNLITNVLNTDGSNEIKKLFDSNVFSNPKPTGLLRSLFNTLQFKSAIFLDFFAGSSTTADAVMQLNSEDGGHRKFIMVQLPEKTYHINQNGKEVPTKGGKAAYDAGFRSIDQISRERIRRVAKKIREDNELTLPEDFDGSFKHYRVVKPVKQTLENIEDFDPNNTNLFTNMVDGFSSQSLEVAGNANGEDTILTTWLAKDGYPFDTNVEEIKFGNYTAHQVENNRLYLINEGWGADQTRELLNQLGTHQLEVQSVVLFGYSFNVAELRELENGLKQLDSKVTLIKRY